MNYLSYLARRFEALGVALLVCVLYSYSSSAPATERPVPVEALAAQLQVGDLVFIRLPYLLTRKIADANNSWVNHVGIVIDVSGAEPVIAESRIPRAKTGGLADFLARSEHGRVAVRRLPKRLSPEEQQALQTAARARLGAWYDLGFDLHSRKQFCSKYVREVLQQATGTSIGEVETFKTLLARHPAADQSFWKLWFLGAIPWQRETVTPASEYASIELSTVFDGQSVNTRSLSVKNRASNGASSL
jgi:hypothetical protein